jgi:NAD(P)H dehydrogenase (quinone)
MKPNVIFYSLYGHIYRMAEAVAEGAREVEGADVGIYQVEETYTPEVLEKFGATEYKKAFEHIPVATLDKLAEADGVIFGTPTRFGMMIAQMRAFLDMTGASGQQAYSSVRWAVSSHPVPPSTEARSPLSSISTRPCCITAW